MQKKYVDVPVDRYREYFLMAVTEKLQLFETAASFAANGSEPNIQEFWTSRQRQGHSLHEISYRACFKPQLPEYFIDKFTEPGDLVVDPFLGRGTTPLQAHIMGRRAAGSDINPLSVMLVRPRLNPPPLSEVEKRLDRIIAEAEIPSEDEELLVFYHPKTLSILVNLKNCFVQRSEQGTLDDIDDWIRMVCLNRLSGHSSGFFSVRTMPPNQAVPIESQKRINAKNNQTPIEKDVKAIVLKKSKSLLRSGVPSRNSDAPIIRCADATNLSYLGENSVDLVVTSPPFLNIVDYRSDNWLRCWFANIDAESVTWSSYSSVDEWRSFIRLAFIEMCKVVRLGGHIAFEVGEVRNGEVKLEKEVILAAKELPLRLEAILINQQSFTKTSNLWGIKNNKGGTNTNRVVLFQRIE